MLLQTNSYIVPKERRAEHARLIRRFRQALARIGCDQFEVYEQVGANWSPGGANGRYVQIMRFRDRQHQQAVQSAERADPGAQQIIAEFCELINFPYQHQHGYFATGFYTSVLPVGPRQAVEYPDDGDGNPPADEIDPAKYQANSAPAATAPIQEAADLESEQEFDLDDAADVPEESGRYEPHAAHQPQMTPAPKLEPQIEAKASQPVITREEADLLAAEDLRLEPDTAEVRRSVAAASDDLTTGAIASPTRIDSPEIAFAQPNPPIDLAAAAEPPAIRTPEIALTQAQTQHSAPSIRHSSIQQSSPAASATPTDLSDLLPDFADDAPVASALPAASPESQLLPDSPEMWESTVVADMPLVEPPPHDPEPTDAPALTTQHAAPSTAPSDEFDPEAAGLIFDEDPADDGAEGSEAHAFAYDKPHDDLLPAPENFAVDETTAGAGTLPDVESDPLLDDARLLDFPGSRQTGPKVRAAMDKDAELLEFEAMVREMDDPTADHGRRAH